MSLEQLTEFFGWCTVINLIISVVTTACLIVAKDWVSSIHSRLLAIEKSELPGLYMKYLSNFKIAVIIFNLTPYLALKIML